MYGLTDIVHFKEEKKTYLAIQTIRVKNEDDPKQFGI